MPDPWLDSLAQYTAKLTGQLEVRRKLDAILVKFEDLISELADTEADAYDKYLSANDKESADYYHGRFVAYKQAASTLLKAVEEAKAIRDTKTAT